MMPYMLPESILLINPPNRIHFIELVRLAYRRVLPPNRGSEGVRMTRRNAAAPPDWGEKRGSTHTGVRGSRYASDTG